MRIIGYIIFLLGFILLDLSSPFNLEYLVDWLIISCWALLNIGGMLSAVNKNDLSLFFKSFLIKYDDENEKKINSIYKILFSCNLGAGIILSFLGGIILMSGFTKPSSIGSGLSIILLSITYTMLFWILVLMPTKQNKK